MDTNITTVGILALLKTLFPSALGAMLAVWYKKDQVTWSDLTIMQKFTLCLFIVVAFLIGTLISHYVSNAILEVISIPTDSWQADSLKIFIGLSSLKLIDHTVKNVDPLLDTIFSNIHNIVVVILSGIKERLKKFFKIGDDN